jgi:hypothetical protein
VNRKKKKIGSQVKKRRWTNLCVASISRQLSTRLYSDPSIPPWVAYQIYYSPISYAVLFFGQRLTLSFIDPVDPRCRGSIRGLYPKVVSRTRAYPNTAKVHTLFQNAYEAYTELTLYLGLVS